jgi:hypothetical protein
MAVNKNFIVQCASCKKLKLDGLWKSAEVNQETEISHGICPECVIILYPEYAKTVLCN